MQSNGFGFHRRLGVVLFTLTVASFAFAQTASFSAYVSNVTILQSRKVQGELKITEAQRTRLNRFADKHRKAMEGIQKKYGGQQPTPELAKKVQPEIAKSFEVLKRDVLTVLTPAQTKRLGEISLQAAGIGAIADDRVAREVGLSPDQLRRFRTTLSDGAKSAADIQRKAVQPILAKYKDVKPKDEKEAQQVRTRFENEMRAAETRTAPQLRAAEQRTQSRLEAILTPAQRTKWRQLQGRPFTP